MPIKGLTDRGLAFPEIGIIRKGDVKSQDDRPGKDLTYFRVVFDERESKSEAIFRQIYGAQPREILVTLPFNDISLVWYAYQEAYTAGRMVARADGERMLFWVDIETGQIKVQDGMPETPVPNDGIVGWYVSQKSRKRLPIKLKPTGRLKVVLPELMRLAYLTLKTTSAIDIASIDAQLQAIASINGGNIAGIPLMLRRRPKMVSVPMADGSRQRVEKWLISIEADPQWVKAKIEAMMKAALPSGNGVDYHALPFEIEAPPDYIDEEEEEEEGDYPEPELVQAVPEAKPREGNQGNRPYAPGILKAKLLELAEKEYKEISKDAASELRKHVAPCLEYIFMSKDKREMFQVWLYGKPSLKDCPDGLVAALNRWLAPMYDKDNGVFRPASEHAIAEANGALEEYLTENGQMGLPI